MNAGPATIRAASKMAEQMTSLGSAVTQQQDHSADSGKTKAKDNLKGTKESSVSKSDDKERAKETKEKLANKTEGKGKSKASSEKSAASPPPAKKSRGECH
jgi:hypothetical protein